MLTSTSQSRPPPPCPACPQAENDEHLLREEPHVEFTGEEGLGRYLDLNEHHMRFFAAKFGRRLEYFEYLTTFADFASVPRQYRLTKPYREYVDGLLSYLSSFHERTQPLAQLDKTLEKVGRRNCCYCC